MTLARGSLGTLSSLSRAIIEPMRMYACTSTGRNVQSAFCIYCSSKSDEKLRAIFFPPVMKQFPGRVENGWVRAHVCVCRLAEVEEWRSGQEPVHQRQTKGPPNDHRERLKLHGAYFTSREVAQQNAAIVTEPSPHLSHASRSASSAAKCLTRSYFPLRLSSLSTFIPGECCTFPALSLRCHYLLFYISPFLGSVKRRAPKSGCAPRELFHYVRCMCMPCALYRCLKKASRCSLAMHCWH